MWEGGRCAEQVLRNSLGLREHTVPKDVEEDRNNVQLQEPGNELGDHFRQKSRVNVENVEKNRNNAVGPEN